MNTNHFNLLLLNKENMNHHFQKQESRIVFSNLREYSYKGINKGYSLKYVMSGQENYRIGHNSYQVNKGEFLLVNDQEKIECSLQSEISVRGMCVYLDEHLLDTVYARLSKQHKDFDTLFKAEKRKLRFLEDIYQAKESGELGSILMQLGNYIQASPNNQVPENDGLYELIAEKLLLQQAEVLRRVNRLKTAKSSTKQELYKRVSLAKQYIDKHYSEKVDIRKISRVAAISEYHFLRTFKQIFGLSPYKYLLKTRLQKASELLNKRNHSITEIASLTGFTDINSFSKSFKKEFQIAPSQFRA